MVTALYASTVKSRSTKKTVASLWEVQVSPLDHDHFSPPSGPTSFLWGFCYALVDPRDRPLDPVKLDISISRARSPFLASADIHHSWVLVRNNHCAARISLLGGSSRIALFFLKYIRIFQTWSLYDALTCWPSTLGNELHMAMNWWPVERWSCWLNLDLHPIWKRRGLTIEVFARLLSVSDELLKRNISEGITWMKSYV